jgi:hypothetical protein
VSGGEEKKNMKKILTVVLLLFFVMLVTGASADDSFRCGSELVNPGASTVKVLLRCGPPSYKEILNPGFEGSRVENWFYNCGSSGFLYVLRFVEGTLAAINNEGYGRGQSDCFGPANR